MQIVIDIPEELKNKIDNVNEDNYRTCIWWFDATLYCAIKNGKPLDAVLDEIKAEFKSKADGDDWYHTTDGLVWEEAIEIIDKHRAESEGK